MMTCSERQLGPVLPLSEFVPELGGLGLRLVILVNPLDGSSGHKKVFLRFDVGGRCVTSFYLRFRKKLGNPT
jgi:hypothetical protein